MNFNRLSTGLRWIAAACLMAFLPALATGMVMEIHSNKDLEGPVVLLRDIARDPHSLPEQWRDREIMPAPGPGDSRKVGLPSIATMMGKYEDMHHVVLRGEASILLKRSGTLLAHEKLIAALRAYAESLPDWEGSKLHVESDSRELEIARSDEEPEIEVLDMRSADNPGEYRFQVKISLPGNSSSTETVSARIEPKQQVWMASRSLNRGHVLSRDDLDSAWMRPDAAGPYIPMAENVVGKEVNRSIRARQRLQEHFLAEPLVARRGDTVNIVASRGGLKVQLRAIALANGRRGERIMCMNKNSEQRLMVRLTGLREATIDF